MNLKPTPPHDAKNRYLKDKKPGVTKKTLRNYRTSLNTFCEWVDSENVANLNTLDSEQLQRFKEYRLERVKPITARHDLMVLKNFIEFCETIQAVPQGMADMVRIPKVNESDEINDDVLSRDEALALLEFLGKFEYASNRHVVMLILWKTGMRISGLRTLDVDDFDEFVWRESKYVELANYAPKDLDILQRRVGQSLTPKQNHQSFLQSCFDFAELELRN